MTDADSEWQDLGGPASWSPIPGRAQDPGSGPLDPFSCLRDVDLFADLAPDELSAMDRMAPATLFRRGQLVYSQAQTARALFIVKSGRVRVFRVTDDGKALTMAILEPGAVFGEMILVGQRMYDSYAEALDDALICQFGAPDVERFLLSDPRIAIRVAKILGGRVAELEDRLTDLALKPLQARVAATLLNLSTAPTGAIGLLGRSHQVRLTHEQLAGVIGATREATSRVLSDLADQGLIHQTRGRIQIPDPARLRRITHSTL